jgi:hypothetical protein
MRFDLPQRDDLPPHDGFRRVGYARAPVTDASSFKQCSTCRKPIGFGAPYFQCSVSTCNRPRIGLFFCSVECWDAHLPMMRHREAWAEKVTAPTRQAYEQAEVDADRRETDKRERATSVSDPNHDKRRIIGAPPTGEPIPKDVLVVVSKLKAYIRVSSGMNTSDDVIDFLSERLRELCNAAVSEARLDGRKTVMERDFRSRR